MMQVHLSGLVKLMNLNREENRILTAPLPGHRSAAVSYINEFLERGENPDGIYNPEKISSDYDAYGEWLVWLNESSDVEEGTLKGDCSSTFFYIRESDGFLYGTVNIRNGGKKASEYGNIGYAVRPSERGKGIATDMLEAALTLCSFMGMETVRAVCSLKNPASLKVLKNNGFVEEGGCYNTDDGCIRFIKYL